MRRSNARGLAVLVTVGLSMCATLALFEGTNGATSVVGHGLPSGISPLAVQPRVTASEDPLLLRVPSTRAPRWAGVLGIGALLVLAAFGRRVARNAGRRWLLASVASVLSRAPPAPAL